MVGCNDVADFGWTAHRFAAAGLDRDTHGREFRIGAVNDAIGSSSW